MSGEELAGEGAPGVGTQKRPILHGILGVLCLLLLGGGVASAADLSQPGEALYGTKTLLEDVRLAATIDGLSRADRAMSYAVDRLVEARLAVAEGRESALPAALGNAEGRITAAVEDVMSVGDRPAARRVDGQLTLISDDLTALVREVQVPSTAVRALDAVVLDAQDRIATLVPTPGSATQAGPAPSPSPGPPATPTFDAADLIPSDPMQSDPVPSDPMPSDPMPPAEPTVPAPTPGGATPSTPVPAVAPPGPPTQPQPEQPAPTREPPGQAVPPPQPPPAQPTVVVPDVDQPQEDDDGVTIDILPGDQPQTVVAPGSD